MIQCCTEPVQLYHEQMTLTKLMVNTKEIMLLLCRRQDQYSSGLVSFDVQDIPCNPKEQLKTQWKPVNRNMKTCKNTNYLKQVHCDKNKGLFYSGFCLLYCTHRSLGVLIKKEREFYLSSHRLKSMLYTPKEILYDFFC